LLLDDLYVRGADPLLATLSLHPSIEIRLFNPFQTRGWGALGGAIELLLAGFRLNHRMHNKAWIVDGQLMIGGGRNIGDAYFDASSQFNFRDLDLVVAGGAASQAVALFDLYWASRRVRPIGRFAAPRPLEGGLDQLRRMLEDAAGSTSAPAYLQQLDGLPDLAALLADGRVLLAADKVRIVADPPGKRQGRHRPPGMVNLIRSALLDAGAKIVLISPYFIPGRRGTGHLIALARRGVAVSILTNSLAATDVLAVHGRYARYRRRLLRAGIELHELKRGGQEGHSLFGSGGASLHTKAFGVDGRLIFVGSFNFDHRSANLNTEMGTFAQDARLADLLGQEHARLVEPERSWRVSLEGGRLAWSDVVAGRRRVLRGEPGATRGRRLVARVLGWLPIEPQL
jgi:cardiolipin synthase C